MTKKRKRTLINVMTLSLVLFTGLFIFLSPISYAREKNATQMEEAKTILAGVSGVVEEAMGSATYTSCINADNKFPALKITLKSIGMLLVMVFALAHFFSNVERGMDDKEAILKVLIEILISALIIINLDKIIEAIVGFGNWLIETVSSASAGGEGEEASLDEDCKKLLTLLTGDYTGDFFWRAGADLKLLLPWVASCLVSGAAKFCIYQAALEIGVRKIFIPLAVADIYQEGLRSPGVRYLKKFLAAFLKIAICCAVGLILNAIAIGGLEGVEEAGTGIYEHLFGQIAISAAGVGFMFKGGEVANDIVGA